MAHLTFRLFGKLSAQQGDQPLATLGAKTQELLCFLLLHRQRPHSRDVLAAQLWPEADNARAKKYLRQTLWQLQHALRDDDAPLLHADPEWIQLDADSSLWLDVAAFEEGLHGACDARTGAETLSTETSAALAEAITHYRGHLLEGWFQEWVLRERERLQELYLSGLDRLIAHSEAQGDIEAGLRYAGFSQSVDRARECTHRRLMRLHYFAGDRASALRQYDRCIIALDEELGVKPSAETSELYERIRHGALSAGAARHAPPSSPRPELLNDVLARLRVFEGQLADLQRRVRSDIAKVEGALSQPPAASSASSAS